MTAHIVHRWAIEYRERDGHWYLRHRCDSNEAQTFATRAAGRAWLADRKRQYPLELREAHVVPVCVTVQTQQRASA